MKRTHRAAIAQETLRIIDHGQYEYSGTQVKLRAAIDDCCKSTKLFLPEDLAALRDQVLAQPSQRFSTATEVANETTLEGLTHLSKSAPDKIAVLNFASAKNPGGGFLGGSQAQEESLARSSALYPSLMTQTAFYEHHRAQKSCLYSDRMILSPNCPVFRDDEGALLAAPLLATFITSPAPNAGAVANNEPHDVHRIPEVLRRRSELVLALAAAHGYAHLILGAWGCGVFRNDPALVAQTFANHLHGAWSGRFQQVRFSVLDTAANQETFSAFKTAFLGAHNS